uniref:Odorant binding protein n=1 Tax=Pardosa pseudoannulata TaxID=330961 RepID=A0A3G1UU09_9ARAC|nr:odorant binding protein [Pardosa pseudoannulata]
MLFSVFALSLVAAVLAAPPTTVQPAVTESDVSSYPVPQIDWGKCPQLKPTETDKEQKRLVIQKCLDKNPPPALETVTDPKQIDDHRELVTTCALKTEGWFNDDGSYKFNRAKTEIESKKLDAEVEKNISKRHQECQDEAVKRFPEGYIQQVQLYQACMDYHIAEICEIELIPPPGGFPLEEFADYDEAPAQPGQPQSSTAQPVVQPSSTAASK